ncbi:hypothetical protein NC651_028163 [Populus alba x Populus x berolinensis]|nr:hypothetical protein NC651_028163 [Populus alba x Populus x berolinensis]
MSPIASIIFCRQTLINLKSRTFFHTKCTTSSLSSLERNNIFQMKS